MWYRIVRQLTFGAISLVALTLLMHSALGQADVDMEGAEAKAAGWKLQFSDDFNRPVLGANWEPVRGKWTLKNRMLHADGSGHIVCNWRFTGDVRLEYDAATDAAKPCDLSGVLNAELGSEASGYYFGFGGQENKYSFLIVRGKRVGRSDTRIVPGKRHHVVCQREGKKITFAVNGKIIISYVDERPIKDPKRDRVGLSVYAPGRFDGVRIYTKNDGKAIPPSKTTSKVQSFEVTGFEVKDPLFEELFGHTPAPKRFFSYTGKYEAGRKGSTRRLNMFRATAKRFGVRYVLAEMLDEAAEYNLICYGKMSEPEYKKRGIATQSRPIERPPGMPSISLPDGTLPLIIGGRGWLMDPRFLDQFARDVEERARERDYWGIPQLDEIFTYYAIKPVPRDKWYKEVAEADKEIREKYGFGKYGMPESHEDGGPFERIAHRRWASDKLTETFAKAYKAAKAVNPDMKLIGPTHGSNATSADMEAWAPYFDILGGQVGGGATNCLFDWVRPGANTKLYVDLTEKPIWMMVHLSKGHAKQRDPEYIREMYSQVFRNGGQGLWLMSSEFYEQELEDAVYAEPAKWRAMLELTKTIRAMRLPRLPEADCAILFSSDSTNATIYGGLSYHNDQIVSAYAAVGPCLRSWPQFVSDRQIQRGGRDLGDYKVLYVPYAAYQQASLLEKIKSYVRAGGLVVCTDTDAFTWNINGEKFGEQWEELTGVRKVGPREADAVMKTVTPNPLPLAGSIGLSALVPGSRIEPKNDRVVNIAVFDDGSPAVTLHPYGKGRVIFFAADPFYAVGKGKSKRSTVALDSPVVRLIEAIQKFAGAKMGHDIWRFKLPPYKADLYQKEKGLCLTGNYVYDVNEPLLEPNNLQTGGTYTYSRAPAAVPDKGKDGELIPFAKGHLTNRLEAFETRNQREGRPRGQAALDKISAQWIVGWDDPAPVNISFDLKGEHPLSTLRLFYSGTLPALEVSGSRDAKAWTKLASAPEGTVGEDVKDVAWDLAGRYRYLKLDFAARRGGAAFELCEVEIWGKPPE